MQYKITHPHPSRIEKLGISLVARLELTRQPEKLRLAEYSVLHCRDMVLAKKTALSIALYEPRYRTILCANVR